jgi:hypothetical protein
MKTIQIQGKEVVVTKLIAREGYRVLHKLGRTIGPALGEMANDNLGKGIGLFFNSLSEDELFDFMTQMAPKITVDNKKLDLAEYGFSFQCVKELLLYNFEDFFSPLLDALGDLKQP